MNTVEIASVIAIALPLAAALVNGLNTVSGNKVYSPAAVAMTALWAVFGSFAASVTALIGMIVQDGPHQVSLFQWIGSGDLSVDVSFLIDRLTMVMMLLVTAVGWLVTRFSVNYLHNEPGFCRYFTVMPLFVAAMLLLVMADNYVLLFLGWEGVGICSYLLIGFYRNRESAARASTKAFVMNRVSDAGLLLAIFLMFDRTGSVVFTEVFAVAGTLPSNEVTGLCFLLLLGGIGKSAQLPLGTWLAQAMEGPTPSSALIHAATMVTAGVYLVVRSSPLFDQAPTALLAVGIVGALTALYGQLVGYTQTDIKGMLAASTTAQLGLMFVLCGLGLFSVAIFHLVAHAFYKSYLFLTAPSILHHLHGGADPGGVRRPSGTVPKLSALVLLAGAGLLLVPVVARGFSDADPVFSRNVWTMGGIGLIALYSVVLVTTRMVSVGFSDHSSADQHGDPGAHHQRMPLSRMARPLVAIAALAAVGFVAGVLPGGLQGSWFNDLIGQAADVGEAFPQGNPVLGVLFVLTLLLLVASGIYGPRYLDRFRDELPAGTTRPLAQRIYWRALERGLLDENYARFVVKPVLTVGQALRRLDPNVVPPVTSISNAAPVALSWEQRILSNARVPAYGDEESTEPSGPLQWLDQATPTLASSAVPSSAADRATPSGRSGFIERSTGLVARLLGRVEEVVFQRGVERSAERSRTASERWLVPVERMLGNPVVMGTLVTIVLVVLIVGTR